MNARLIGLVDAKKRAAWDGWIGQYSATLWSGLRVRKAGTLRL